MPRFDAPNVLRDKASDFGRVGGDHEMCGAVNHRRRSVIYGFDKQCADTLHCRITCFAPKHQRWNLDGRK